MNQWTKRKGGWYVKCAEDVKVGDIVTVALKNGSTEEVKVLAFEFYDEEGFAYLRADRFFSAPRCYKNTPDYVDGCEEVADYIDQIHEKWKIDFDRYPQMPGATWNRRFF